MVPETILLNVTTEKEPEPTPNWVPAPTMGPYMVTICSERGSDLDEELGELVKSAVWGLRGP